MSDSGTGVLIVGAGPTGLTGGDSNDILSALSESEKRVLYLLDELQKS